MKNAFRDAAPGPLQTLLTGNTPQARNFQAKLRNYNSLFQMAYSGIKSANTTEGMSMHAINGSVYHKIHALNPPNKCPRRFAQLYIMDEGEEMVSDCLNALNLEPGQRAQGIWRSTVEQLQAMWLEHNRYCVTFNDMRTLNVDLMDQYKMVITEDGSLDLRRYNRPTVNEVGGVMPGEDDELGQQHVAKAITGTGVLFS